MQRSLAALAACLTTGFLAAQGAQATKTVPANAATTEGNSSSYYPFLYDKGKYQHLIDGGALVNASAVIQAIAYRRDGGSSTNFVGRTIQTWKISIGYSGNSAATMSTTFASNWSGTPTVIFNGAYNLPNNPPVTGLGPWNINWTLTRPWVYTKASGNLLIEFEAPGNAQQKNEYYVDSHAVGVPGSYQVFGTPGPFQSGDRHSLFSNGTNLKPGGTADLRATGLLKAYPALAVWGLSNKMYGPIPLPFHLAGLGASNNFLYCSMDITFPLVLTQVGSTFSGTAQLPLPNVAGIGGATIYGTAIYADPPSNTLGLVFSRGVTMNIASTGSGPSQVLGTPTSANATGRFLSSSGTNGPVIEFTGAFN